MVRFCIAIACVLLVVPSSIATGQQRKSTPASLAQPPRTSASPQNSGRTVPGRPVSRSQDSPAAAGQEPPKEQNSSPEQLPILTPEQQRELDRLLQFWSASSEEIKRLEGKHVRFVYDMTFEVERQSEGEFAYESPDKGRIDSEPVPVTPQMIDARARETKAAAAEKRRPRVRLKKNGEPFDLVEAQPELWICDGQRVYELNLEKKEAQVAQLPANMQGKNIMDSPLPFLFGMPPEEAKKRFHMSFTNGTFDPREGRAYLTIYPRLPQDAQSWKKADIILDLKDFLPLAVKLLSPAGTSETVYQFRDFVKNEKDWVLRLKGVNPKNWFNPDLRGLNVQLIGSEGPETTPGLVNVEGLIHTEAIIQLERQGLKRVTDKTRKDENQIILEVGPPAKTPEEKYTVKSQDPAPGTPVKPGMKIRLTLWTDPATAKN